MYTFYLAGSINGLSYASATEWRKDLTKQITLLGHNVLDPMRGKEAIADATSINDAETPYKPSAILARDLWDIDKSDYIIANLESLGDLAMIGTLMELGVGLQSNKHLILFNVPAKYENHPFFHSARKLSTLEDLKNFLTRKLTQYI